MTGRPLTPDEHRLLKLVLSNMEPDAILLLQQLEQTVVIDDEDPAGWLGLQVAADAAPIDLPDAPIGGRNLAEGPNGEPLGERFVWVRAGRLHALHHASYTDEPPTAMPAPESMRFW